MPKKKGSVDDYRGLALHGIKEQTKTIIQQDDYKERVVAVDRRDEDNKGTSPTLSPPREEIRNIEIQYIEQNPDQPRKVFDNIEDLAASIRQKGVLTPLLVRRVGPDRFRLIAGERRLRAAALSGLPTVPCIVRNLVDDDEISLIENVHRDDLKFVEQVVHIQRIMDNKGYKQKELAEKLVIEESFISEALKVAVFVKEYEGKFGSIEPLHRAKTSDGRALGRTHFVEIASRSTFDEKVDLFNSAIASAMTIRQMRAHKTQRRSTIAVDGNKQVLNSLKNIRKSADPAVIKKIDISPLTIDKPRLLRDLEKTESHLTDYMTSIRELIRKIKAVKE